MFVVDLDRTLIRTDLLWESLLNGLSTRPFATLAALGALARGRGALKAALADFAPDPAELPLDPAVLAEIRAARERGERTALVSASDARLVRALAARTGLFDEAHGSEPGRNLKGPAKAAFLQARFGAEGFSYLGDSPADLAVWRAAAASGGTVGTAGAGPALRAAAEAVAREAREARQTGDTGAREAGGAVRHVAPRDGWAGRAHLRALRPHQWLKNVLVFLPVLAAHDLSAAALGAALAAFLAFSLAASSVYVLNDLLDLAADRAHPRKCRRPFASGDVPLVQGLAMAPVLLLAGLLVAALLAPPAFLGVLALYYAGTLAYSFALKRQLVIDVFALAGLYTIRIIAGAAAAGVPLSPWMLAFSGFLFLSLAAMKRQAELADGIRAGREKAAGRAYRAEDLPAVTMMAVSAGFVAALVLALYVSSPEVRVLYARPVLLWGACPALLFWVARAVMLAGRGQMTDDPLVFAVKDPTSLAAGAAAAAFVLAAGPL
jgi:4-hydroxybenzoate polyprenyltransferase/phosphoserine phosphatase